MSLDNVKDAAIEYVRLKEEAKDIEARLEQLKEIIGPALAGRGDTAFGDASGLIYTLNVKEMKGRASIDKDAMKADGIDPAKYEKVGKPFVTITTKVVKPA